MAGMRRMSTFVILCVVLLPGNSCLRSTSASCPRHPQPAKPGRQRSDGINQRIGIDANGHGLRPRCYASSFESGYPSCLSCSALRQRPPAVVVMCHPQCGFYGAAIIQLGALIVALLLVSFTEQLVEPAQRNRSAAGSDADPRRRPGSSHHHAPGASSASRDEKSNPGKTCRRGDVCQLQRVTRNREVGYGSSGNALGQQY